jgi:nucleoside-diphosphate-sugar epimerase
MIEADFRQVDKVVDAMQDVDAVIHLGAIVGDPACALDEKLTTEINLVATRMIAEVAKGSGVNRFIFASTCSVYGTSDQILDERSTLRPVSLYARSKIACEKVLLQMADERFAPTIVRFGTIYGLSGRTRFDLVVNLLTAKAFVEKKMTIFGGDQWRPFLHVDDAALALVRCLKAQLRVVRDEVINVGSNEQNFTIRQVGEIIRGLVPTTEVVEAPPNGDRRNYHVDFSKIAKLVGFRPTWTLEAGVRQVIHGLESGAIKDYRDPKHSNVKSQSDEASRHLSANGTQWAEDLMKESQSVVEPKKKVARRVGVRGSDLV